MLNASDVARMQADLDLVISDHSQDIAFRRGTTTLDPQTVRIERIGSARQIQGDGSEETRTAVVIVGDVDLDVKKDDRFTLDGELYQVTSVSPNKQMGVQAEAELAQ